MTVSCCCCVPVSRDIARAPFCRTELHKGTCCTAIGGVSLLNIVVALCAWGPVRPTARTNSYGRIRQAVRPSITIGHRRVHRDQEFRTEKVTTSCTVRPPSDVAAVVNAMPPCRDMVVAVAGHGAHVPICPRQAMLRATPVNAPAHFLRDLDIFLSLCISSWRVPVVLVPTKLSSDPSLRRGGRREIICRSALLYV
jgi:hypothetical protein